MRLRPDTLETTFFTADNHFGHENIIKFANRPFTSVEEMDEAMIERWNKVVPPNGTVYHLGDFTLGGPDTASRYLSRLNGRIIFLHTYWHHDVRWIDHGPYQSAQGVHIELIPPLEVLELQINGRQHPLAITLCHYPLAVWDRKHYGAWHLHGHSHGQYKYQDVDYAFDVGVDCWNFTPLSFGGVLETMYSFGWVE